MLDKQITYKNPGFQLANLIGSILELESKNQQNMATTNKKDFMLDVFVERSDIFSDINVDFDIPTINVTTESLNAVFEKTNVNREKATFVTKISIDLKTQAKASEFMTSDVLANTKMKNAINLIQNILYSSPYTKLENSNLFDPLKITDMNIYVNKEDETNIGYCFGKINLEIEHCAQYHQNDGDILKDITNLIYLDTSGKFVGAEFVLENEDDYIFITKNGEQVFFEGFKLVQKKEKNR